jgi:NADP-dependent 3-hydroxy acid dehydrogenase YdfG
VINGKGLEDMSTETAVKPLTGRDAVVTGASSGIGEATAEHLAALSVRVVILARRAERLGDLVARIEKNGGSALALSADVTDAAAVHAAAERVATELGGAYLLFNNAGVMLASPVEEVRTDQWQQQIDVNVLGLMNEPTLRRWSGGTVPGPRWSGSLPRTSRRPWASS